MRDRRWLTRNLKEVQVRVVSAATSELVDNNVPGTYLEPLAPHPLMDPRDLATDEPQSVELEEEM